MSIQQAARQYIEQGFRPVPMWGMGPDGRCGCGGLLPNGRECRPGKHSPEPIETDWKETRYRPEDFTEGQNMALALGPWKPGRWLVCFDFDGVDGGDIPFFTLPPTLTQKSPRGLHLFFTVPELEPLGNWNDVFRTKHADGVALDIRYARGRINVAPSRTAFGSYHWTNWREPAPLPPEVPERIYDDRRARKLPVLDRWDRGWKGAGAP